jgi:PiT family inorganic phosphate transporter
MSTVDATRFSTTERENLADAQAMNGRLHTTFSSIRDIHAIPKNERFEVRKDIMLMDRHVKSILNNVEIKLSENDKRTVIADLKEVRRATDYAPKWVLLMISLSLGFGTMVGWKRIVKTVGEKIGKEHLTYAQGASAELVAASTIGLSSSFGLPVSTTHVLSSGIAGSMVANKGVKNLQPETVRNILIAWFLTLPVVMLMAGTLFLMFRSLF